MEKIFWLNQLLILLWDLEKWEWLHLSNFVSSIFGPLPYCLNDFSISSATTVNHPLLWKLIRCLRAFSTSGVGGGGGRKALFASDDLWAKSVITVPLQPKGFHQFQSQLVKTVAFRPFLFFIRVFSCPAMARFLHDWRPSFFLVKDKFVWCYQMKKSTVLASATLCFNSVLSGFSSIKTISAFCLCNAINIFVSILCNVHVVNVLTWGDFIHCFHSSYRKAL